MAPLPFYLLAMSLLYNAPLVAVLWFARHRIRPMLSAWTAALGFVAAAGYTLWRIEWFDVWRHGIPSPRYLVFYLPYLIGAAGIGWLVGKIVAGPARRRAAGS